MGRTLLSPREIEQKELYIGKILIFCEGDTEKNYFQFFSLRNASKINFLTL